MAVKLVHVVALLAAGAATAPEAAQACRRSCRQVRVEVPPFGVQIGWPRAHIVVRGPILGYGVATSEDEAPPPPEMPPPPPAPAYFASPPPPPPPSFDPSPTSIYAQPRQRERNIGVGIRGSALQVGRDGPSATGVGALLRFRSRPVELELDVGREEYNDSDRTDTRVGASLLVPLVNGGFSPFLVAGTGMNFAYFGETGDQLHQGFLAVGAGLSLKLGSRFVLSSDARYELRRFFDDDMTVANQHLATTRDDPAGVRDEALEVRLNGVLYF